MYDEHNSYIRSDPYKNRSDPHKNLIIKINNGFVRFDGLIVREMIPHLTEDFEQHYHNIEFVDKTHFKIFKSNGDLFTVKGQNPEGIWVYINNKLYSKNKYNLSSQFNSISLSQYENNVVYFLNYGDDNVLDAIRDRRDNDTVLSLINPLYNTFSIHVNNNGYNALMLASSYIVVEKLLIQGIDKNYVKDIKTSALKSACEGYSSTFLKFKMLLKHKVKIKPEEGLLHAASKWNKLDIIQHLVINKMIFVNDTNVNGETPLIIAAKFCNNEAVKLLIALGASKSHKDKKNRTALYYAREHNQLDIHKMLIKKNPLKRFYYYIISKKLPITRTKFKSKVILDTSELDRVPNHVLFQLESTALEYFENFDINYKCQEKNGRSDNKVYDYDENRISYIVENDIIISCGYG